MKNDILNILKEAPLSIDLISKLLDKPIDVVKELLDSMIDEGLIKYSSNTELYKLIKKKNKIKRTGITEEEVLECFTDVTLTDGTNISKKLSASKKEVEAILRKLRSERKLGSVYGLYSLMREATLIVKENAVFAHVEKESKDYYISESNEIPYDGDTALICLDLEYPTGKCPCACLKKIIKRAHTKIIGSIKINSKKTRAYICSNDPSFNVNAVVSLDNLNGAVSGQIVEGEILEYGFEITARVTKILGNKDDVGIDILQIALEYGFESEFSPETIKEIDNISDYVDEKELKGRRDFRNLNIITIDGDDSKDFDDAVSLEIDEFGNYHLGVYIADVANYVKEGSSLDSDALKRGTSVYLADRVIPMLPKKLSNGICSLNEGVDRLVLASLITYDSKGKLIDYEICEGVIRSSHRMTYKKVNEILNGNIEITNQYLDIKDMLFNMNDLSKMLRNIRTRKGALEFEADEYKFKLDDNGKPIEIIKRERDDAEKLIEDFMLSANEVVAYHMNLMNLPIIYRVHESPDQDKLHNTFTILKNMNINTNIKKIDINPKDIQKLLDDCKDNPNYGIINSLLLRSMMKAKYSDECLGHYGLAMKYYCHFTSPIRRYPDLITHRMIKKLLLHPNNLDESINYYGNILGEIAKQNSLSEKKAVECERAVEDFMFSWYMIDKIDKEYIGTITSITNFGMFVTLDFGVEGLVLYKNLDSYFEFDESRLTASDGYKTYHLGDKIKIVVLSSDKKSRKVDFIIKNRRRKDFYEDYMY